MAELDDLNELYAKFEKNTNFEFISFTFENSEKIATIRKKYTLKYPIISIPDSTCRRLNLNSGYPTNIIVDKDNSIRFMSVIGQSDYFKTLMYPIISKEL